MAKNTGVPTSLVGRTVSVVFSQPVVAKGLPGMPEICSGICGTVLKDHYETLVVKVDNRLFYVARHFVSMIVIEDENNRGSMDESEDK